MAPAIMPGIIMPMPGAQPQAGRAARLALVGGRGLDAARGLEGHVALHVADRAHARALVDHLLHFLRRRDGADQEVHELEAVFAEVVGDTAP
jgi:hypothetical protein